MIRVVTAPPYLAVQDAGWEGFRAQGMPSGGAMDRWASAVANLVVGNPAGAAAREWALGPGVLRFEADALCAVGGADVDGSLGGEPIPPYTVVAARAGDELRIERITRGRFVYLAVRGGIDVPPVLGSRATYLAGGFGGLDGRLLRAGDALPVGGVGGLAPAAGWALPDGLRPTYPADEPLRAILGPQANLFSPDSLGAFEAATFRVARASDRAGYRLEGPPILPAVKASLPSEPACPGAVQVPDSGQPIVLMPDGPTVGGYPKIAVVASADLSRLAQRSPGDAVRFRLVSVEEAQAAYRRRAVDLHTIAETVRRSSLPTR
jgi:antagonist of KipI